MNTTAFSIMGARIYYVVFEFEQYKKSNKMERI